MRKWRLRHAERQRQTRLGGVLYGWRAKPLHEKGWSTFFVANRVIRKGGLGVEAWPRRGVGVVWACSRRGLGVVQFARPGGVERHAVHHVDLHRVSQFLDGLPTVPLQCPYSAPTVPLQSPYSAPIGKHRKTANSVL